MRKISTLHEIVEQYDVLPYFFFSSFISADEKKFYKYQLSADLHLFIQDTQIYFNTF